MELTSEIAMILWKSESYRIINKYLAGDSYEDYNKRNITIKYYSNTYRIIDVINKIKSIMIPFSELKKNYIFRNNHSKFYRGDKKSVLLETSYNKETFISVTSDIETAVAFQDSGVIFQIIVDDDVFVTRTGIENEILIEPNSCCKYEGFSNIILNFNNIKVINIHITTYSESFSNYGDLLKRLNKENKNEYEISDHIKDLEIASIRIKDLKDDFNLLELKEYTIIDFKEDLKSFNIIYSQEDLRALFEFYLSIK
jgi:hypothetical protein